MAWDIVPAADVVSQAYGCTSFPEWPDSSCPAGYFHAGIDLAGANVWQKPVYSTRAGVVAAVGITYLGPYAVAVRADEGVFIEHGHLDSALVQIGQRVDVGTPLGLVGTRGNSTGPHLHVEVRLDGPGQGLWLPDGRRATVDPTPYLTFAHTQKQEEDDVPAPNEEMCEKVRSWYVQHLGRHVNPQDLAYWVPKLRPDRTNWDTVAAAIQDSPEGQAYQRRLLALKNGGQ